MIQEANEGIGMEGWGERESITGFDVWEKIPKSVT